MQSRGLPLGNVRSVRLEGGSHLGRGELLHLLWGAADESAGIEQAVQLGENGVEEGGAADSLEQVVILALLLDVVGGLVRENA